MNEMRKKIYEAYPITEKEKKCAMEKRKRDYQRQLYRKRLMQPHKEKKEYDRE